MIYHDNSDDDESLMLMSTISDMETTIMHRLQNSILQQSSLLIDVVHYASELDWLVPYKSTTSLVFHLAYLSLFICLIIRKLLKVTNSNNVSSAAYIIRHL